MACVCVCVHERTDPFPNRKESCEGRADNVEARFWYFNYLCIIIYYLLFTIYYLLFIIQYLIFIIHHC